LNQLNEQYPLIGNFGYGSIPNSIRQFISAQFGIQFGMMIPLSAWYFCKFPVGGTLANFIAIPLVGVNVQLGIFAGLVGMIPKIGVWLALVLNATNWFLCKLFLLTAHFFSSILPYPHITQWTISRLILYVAVLAIFIWWNAFNKLKEELYYRLKLPVIGDASGKFRIFEKIAGLVILIVLIILTAHKPPKGIRITELALGGAESTVIQLGSGKNIIINGGLRQFADDNPFSEYDQGDRVVFNYLKRQGVTTVDAVIVQSLRAEYLTGLYTIAVNADLKVWYDALDHTKINSRISITDFFTALGDQYLIDNLDRKDVRQIYESYIDILKILEKRKIPVRRIKQGDVLCRETINGAEFKIICLQPGDEMFDGSTSLDDNSAVLRCQYGEKSFLFGGPILERGLEYLDKIEDKNLLKADVLIAPSHGVPLLLGWMRANDNEINERITAYTQKIMDLVKPEYVVASFDKPRNSPIFKKKTLYKYIDMSKIAFDIYKSNAKRLYRTDFDKSIIIESDTGKDLRITTMVEIDKLKMKKKAELKNSETADDTPKQEEDKAEDNL